jgi:hypothetical protein
VVGLTQAKRGDLTNENNTFQLFVAVAFRASVGFVRLRAGLGAAITLWVLGGSALMLVGRPASAVPADGPGLRGLPHAATRAHAVRATLQAQRIYADHEAAARQ